MLTVNIKEDLDRRDEPLQLPLDGGHLCNVRWEGETVQTQAQPIINTHLVLARAPDVGEEAFSCIQMRHCFGG